MCDVIGNAKKKQVTAWVICSWRQWTGAVIKNMQGLTAIYVWIFITFGQCLSNVYTHACISSLTRKYFLVMITFIIVTQWRTKLNTQSPCNHKDSFAHYICYNFELLKQVSAIVVINLNKIHCWQRITVFDFIFRSAIIHVSVFPENHSIYLCSTLHRYKREHSISTHCMLYIISPTCYIYMGQVTELWLSCYLVLLSIDSKTRWQDSRSSVTWPIFLLWADCRFVVCQHAFKYDSLMFDSGIYVLNIVLRIDWSKCHISQKCWSLSTRN